MILKPRPREKNDPEMSEARNTWWNTRDTKAALRCLRKPQKSIEGNLLLALDKLGPTAYLNSLEKVSLISRILHLSSFSHNLRKFFLIILQNWTASGKYITRNVTGKATAGTNIKSENNTIFL